MRKPGDPSRPAPLCPGPSDAVAPCPFKREGSPPRGSCWGRGGAGTPSSEPGLCSSQGATDSEKRIHNLAVANEGLKQSLALTQGLLQQLATVPAQPPALLVKVRPRLLVRDDGVVGGHRNVPAGAVPGSGSALESEMHFLCPEVQDMTVSLCS